MIWPTAEDRNRQHLDTALDQLGRALLPFLQRAAVRTYGKQWSEKLEAILRGARPPRVPVVEDAGVPDLSNLLYVMRDPTVWRDLFSSGQLRDKAALVWEVQTVRNRDAHIHHYTNASTFRDLDFATLLLGVISPAQAARVALLRHDVLIRLYEEERAKMAHKREDVLEFLARRVFNPVLASASVPADVRRRVKATVEALEAKDTAREIIEYYWTAIRNSTDLPKRMKEVGLVRVEEVMEEFRTRFSDRWLPS